MDSINIEIIKLAMTMIHEQCSKVTTADKNCHECGINEFCQTFLGQNNDPSLWPIDAISLIIRK